MLLGWRVVRISGQSMSPLLEDGDYALARRAARGSPTAGDVVLVDHPSYGRIVKRLGPRTTQGYSLHGESPLSTSSALLGRVPRERIIARLVLRISPGRVTRLNRRSWPQANRAS